MYDAAQRDEDLRHCLTVIGGYLALALEERGTKPGAEFWSWLARAQEAAVDAQHLLETPTVLPPAPPAAA
jgi:hypothetical protein